MYLLWPGVVLLLQLSFQVWPCPACLCMSGVSEALTTFCTAFPVCMICVHVIACACVRVFENGRYRSMGGGSGFLTHKLLTQPKT